ncbi:MAG TPA: ABC transporter ATP-binding protein [Thermoanaerobaculia bacterium]
MTAAAVAGTDGAPAAHGDRVLLSAEGLVKHFPVRRGLLGRRRGVVRAVDGVGLAVERGECLALVGESGSGKTTLGRCLVRLIEPDAGRVFFAGEDLLALPPGELRRRRRRFQMVFQDPDGSLNPRRTVGQAVGEPLAVHRLGDRPWRRRRTAELLDLVGLPGDAAGRYPHELSGGQRQRVGIARALATEPDLVVADEPVSALDVSVRAQVINLLASLGQRLGLAMVFIAHDLALVEHLADRVAVMFLGRIVEEGPREAVFARPLHPYTVALLSAVPVPDPAVHRPRLIPGELPSALDPPPGCPYHPRCPIARDRCRRDTPPLAGPDPAHRAACWYPGELPPPPAAEARMEPSPSPAVASDDAAT